MRGKLNVMVFTEGTDRITPAYAGKTQGKIFPPRDMKDHPRVCGKTQTIQE